jgi:peptidoglycan/xylan/chitin deacetylase (PgdA/CDA1 family)
MTDTVIPSTRVGSIPFRSARQPSGWTLPGDAQLAVWVIPNVEFFPLDRPIPGGTGKVPDVPGFASHDYGARVGFWRILDALEEVGARGTAATNASVVEAYPEIIAAMREHAWDVMGHSYSNSRRLTELDDEEERAEISSVTRTLTDALGFQPRGWLGAGLQERWSTVQRLAELGYEYVADWVSDDRPNRMLDSGLLTVPYSLEVNDKPAFDTRYMSPVEFADMAIRQFDVLHREGAQEPRVMAIALHPYLIGLPHRIGSLRRLLGHIAEHDGVWWATGAEIAARYRATTV